MPLLVDAVVSSCSPTVCATHTLRGGNASPQDLTRAILPKATTLLLASRRVHGDCRYYVQVKM
ncbi:hypothetical protein HJG54_15890 [Leptolyngbya sp. NK1-12]|uniref:Uncharacterized protein n=1 Tax=Leptolyngbya sp. NK1-12 TaxID=2547451 RepID=A0AA96WF23_9CYAN|nr:hypothetical protein [Leptolyngbya sp. NK1-12]WNZ24188.1 hypothetical protein HJG54_15890 [Leptolyngbya sp. NK1-12]